MSATIGQGTWRSGSSRGCEVQAASTGWHALTSLPCNTGIVLRLKIFLRRKKLTTPRMCEKEEGRRQGKLLPAQLTPSY